MQMHVDKNLSWGATRVTKTCHFYSSMIEKIQAYLFFFFSPFFFPITSIANYKVENFIMKEM